MSQCSHLRLTVLKYQREKVTYIESRRALAAWQARVPHLPLEGGRQVWWSSLLILAPSPPSQESPTPDDTPSLARWLGVHWDADSAGNISYLPHCLQTAQKCPPESLPADVWRDNWLCPPSLP